MHIAEYIEDARGDLVEMRYACSDFCHRQWCLDNGTPYLGWDGCHELEFSDRCVSCDSTIPGVCDDDA